MLDPDKSEARRTAQELRALITPEERQAAAKVLSETGIDFLGIEPDGILAAYAPIRSELDPAPLVAAARSAGITVALPCVVAMDAPLVFREWHEGDELKPGAFNVPEPPAGRPVCYPNALLVPCLAFDRVGYRLGYGKGFYDRTLADLRSRHPIRAAGVAFTRQELAGVPRHSLDEPLDWVITERGIIEIAGGSACA